MKTILLGVFTFVSVALSAQTEVDFLNAIGKKDVPSAKSLLASSVTFCINDKQKKISSTNVVNELTSFVEDIDIKNFKILHNGKSADKTSSYRVARLKTNEKTYRIFAYAEVENGTSKVVEVRIDEM